MEQKEEVETLAALIARLREGGVCPGLLQSVPSPQTPGNPGSSLSDGELLER